MRRLGCSLLFFSLFSFFSCSFLCFFLSLCFFFGAFYYKNTMDERRPKILMVQDIDGPNFYYGHPSSHCTSDLIATNTYYTTLEYDECVAIFFRVCGHDTKSSEHMEILDDN